MDSFPLWPFLGGEKQQLSAPRHLALLSVLALVLGA